MTRFFKNEKAIKGMLDVYAAEIAYRDGLLNWYMSREDYGGAEDSKWILSNAIKILNIVKPGRTFNPARTRERVALIKQYWGRIPEAPKGLREIRNKLEHYDEYIEEWFSSTEGDFAYKLETIGMIYRYDPSNGGVVYYLENYVVIKDVIDWVKQMGQLVINWDYTLS
jgi:hypothetical protein